MARHALLIGVSEFSDKRLARLNAPTNDVIALRGVLQDSARGGFNTVEMSIDEDFMQVRDRVSRFFHDKAPDDLLFFYYSGHGILGRGNRLYLATAGSDLDAPRERSLAAKEIREFIEECRAERQVVVLDCCHSGAFAEHAKSGAPAPAVTADTFAAGEAGLYVLTASDALQYAWDGQELRTGEPARGAVSRFTAWLVAGLGKGEAAPEDEAITMDALYSYLFRRARAEGAPATPQRFVHGGVGQLAISRNPDVGARYIDPTMAEALGSPDRLRRLGAVAQLVRFAEERDTAHARAACAALHKHLQREQDPDVRNMILATLPKTKEPTAIDRGSVQRSKRSDSGDATSATGKPDGTPVVQVQQVQEETTAGNGPDGQGNQRNITLEDILKAAGAIFIVLIALAIFA